MQKVLIQAAEQGPLRTMLPPCHVGGKLNRIRARAEQREGETSGQFSARLYKQLQQIAGLNKCMEQHTCGSCRRGQRVIATLASRQTGAQPPHVEALADAFGKEGWDRRLPQQCPVGRQLSSLTAADDGEAVPLMLAALLDKYKCTSHPSCLCCATGRNLFYEAVFDLAENGLEGDAGRVIKEGGGLLW